LTGKNFADVVGARVMVEAGGRKQYRFGKGGGSYASSPDRRFVVGIGDTDKIERIVVRWPNGVEQEWLGPKPDQYHKLQQK
jgi:enediyne biosynthesis protein E4